MNIKVCGITELKQLQQLDGLDVDFAGLIFYKDSPRYAGDKLSGKDLKNADFDLKKVGVFVNPEMIDVLDAIDEYGLEVVQLHGDESPEMCEDLSTEVEVIKAFRISGDEDIDELVPKRSLVGEHRVVPDSGHWIHLDQPVAVIESVLRMLAFVESLHYPDGRPDEAAPEARA